MKPDRQIGPVKQIYWDMEFTYGPQFFIPSCNVVEPMKK